MKTLLRLMTVLVTAGFSISSSPCQVVWTQKRVLSGQGCPMAFDSTTGRALAFSGLGETYEWNGNQWSALTPATAPVSRCGHAMAYDSTRKRIVFFGGHNEYPPYQNYDDTWEWDGGNWIRRTPAIKPSTRWGYAMVYDVARKRCVLFGGFDSTNLDDTWEWDGSNWLERKPTTRPPARWFHGMAYDSVRNVCVLFGGNDGSQVFGDTWEWDGSNWTKRTPIASAPARFAPGMTYDPVRRRTVVFGGDPTGGGKCLDDTWEWDGTTWSRKQPTAVPAARYRPGIAFDTTRNQVLMFSGNSGTPDFAGLTDTWSFDGTNWARLAPHVVPVRGMLAYDSARRRTICYGGYLAGTAQPSGTWEWDGTSWSERYPLTNPPARARSTIAFDRKRSTLVMFGGDAGTALLDDTWEWNGSDWRRASPTVRPAGRVGHASAYDATRNTVVIQGGVGPAGPLFDTWEWDGAKWTDSTHAIKPSSFIGHAMAFDERRQRLVMFGGFDLGGKLLTETWEWDGLAWSRRTPANSPAGRYDHALTYEALRGRGVLYGGYFGAKRELYDTWEWDGTGWSQRTVVTIPRSLPGNSMTFDADRERIVFFGNHTWEYATTSPARAELFGSGCMGSVGTPRLQPVEASRPWLGDVFEMDVTSAPSPLLAVVWLGASRTNWGVLPLPLDLTGAGMSGCSLLASPDILLPVAGKGRVALAIPAQTSLIGAMIHHQAFVADPPVNALGLVTSNGVSGRIGAR